MKNKFGYFDAISFLQPYIKPFRANFSMFFTGILFQRLLEAIMPVLFGVMIDQILYAKNLQAFFSVSIVFAVLTIFACLLYFFIYAQHHYLMSMYVFGIQKELFSQAQRMQTEARIKQNSGEMTELIGYHARECMHFVIRDVIHFSLGLLKTLLILIYLFLLSPAIGGLMLLFAPLHGAVTLSLGKRIKKEAAEERRLHGVFLGYLFEIFAGIKEIRLQRAKQQVRKKVKTQIKNNHRARMHTQYTTLHVDSLTKGINLVMQLVLFYVAADLARKGQITVGLIMVVFTYFETLKSQFVYTANTIMNGQMRAAYIKQMRDFLSLPREDEDGKPALKISSGQVSFSSVFFAYEKRVVLENFSLHISPNEIIGIVGKSGVGKSTIAYLLAGFYTPQKGSMLIDGQDISSYSLASLRKQVGFVMQEAYIEKGTLRENLRLGKRNATDQELIDALKKAGLRDMLQQLDMTIETDSLSGGEKQRIAMARIYLRDPKILILDEATSALDKKTEQEILTAWQEVLRNKTVFVISHRWETVAFCNRIIFLENGVIREEKTPSEINREKTLQTLFVTGENE
ncbi:MAG: ABC transporter ATP-binding protein [Christensenellaceae bacterium]|jgi:ABC-type multidrug transport system fused ATPase/permease subunit